MYVYELARELGAEPRELIECAAVEQMGHISPNTKLSQEQILLLRESYVRSVSPSRGSLFAGGARQAAPPPPAAEPAPPPVEPAPPADPYDSPLLPPIHDSNEASGSSGAPGGLGGPLTFDPFGGGSTDQAPPPSAPSSPQAPRWDEPPLWEPLSTGTSLAGPPITGHQPVDYSGTPRTSDPDKDGRLTEAEYDRRYKVDDWDPVKPDSSSVSRNVVVGVLGLIVIVVASMYAGRELDIIGPGAERNCMITAVPADDREGTVEEIVCVNGYGEEIRRDILDSGDTDALDFGSNAAGETARIVRLDDFCRGASAFLEFRDGFADQVATSASMVELGAWYDEHDGFGSAGQARMVASFGRAGPDTRVVDLAAYLNEVETAARSRAVEQAQMFFAAAEQTYGDHVLQLRNFSSSNC